MRPWKLLLSIRTRAELGARLDFAMTHAVSSLGSLDANLFARRYPFQTFERSKAELIWGALLVVIDHVRRLTSMIRGGRPAPATSVFCHRRGATVRMEGG